jgi:hypothetical protein
MSRRGVLLSTITVLVVGAIAAWWFHTYKRVSLEIDLPMRGEARYNPLFALKRSLQAHGIEVISSGNSSIDTAALQPGDALVLYSDVRTLNEATSEALLGWVDRGGHLVFAMPSGEGKHGPLLETLGLYVHEHQRCLEWPVSTAKSGKDSEENQKASHCFQYRFDSYEDDLTETFDWVWGNADDGYLFGRQYRGEGSLFVAGELDFLDNSELDEPGHADLAWQLLAPVLGDGRVHLIYAADVAPMYVLILRHGWPILLPLSIALLAWLWARSQRFGPLLPLASGHRRALLEHVQASGEFVFRRGRTMSLYAAVQRLFMARLRRREPALAALDGEALVQGLSTRYDMPAASIRQALNPVDLARPDQFIATIKTLMQLRARL